MMAREISKASASSSIATEWKSIDWNSVVATARQLQMRIAKAYRKENMAK